MYYLIISPKAKKEIKLIPERYRKAIGKAIKELKEYPQGGKPLTKELTKFFSWKVGVYRIIYKVNKHDGIITIITAGHRGTIYIK